MGQQGFEPRSTGDLQAKLVIFVCRSRPHYPGYATGPQEPKKRDGLKMLP